MNNKIFRFHKESRSHGGINWRISVLNEIFLLHTHDYYEIEYASEGVGTNTVNGVEYPITPGSVWLLGPNDDHMLAGENVRIHHMGVYLPDAPREITSLLEKNATPLIGVIEDEDERRIFESYFSLFEHAPDNTFLCEKQYQATATLILIYCLAHLQPAKREESKTANYVRSAIRYVNEHLKEPLSLSTVAEQLHVVPCYLSGIFSHYAGCTFNEYVTRCRLRYARMLLAQTDKSVTEVAGESGFGCVSAMNRAFRKYLDTCPSAFRKKE